MATYQFQSCCNSNDIFRVSGLTSLYIGDIYSGDSIYFSGGCATIVEDNSTGVLYDGTSLTLIGPYNDCSECITCPSDTVCFTLYFDFLTPSIINVTLPSSGTYNGKNYYYIDGSFYPYIYWNSGDTRWIQSNSLGGTQFQNLFNNSNNLPINDSENEWSETFMLNKGGVIESYSGTCLDSYCSGNTFCVSFNLPSYTGYNGNYTYAGIYNDGNYYTGDSITESYIFRKDQRWCLSDSLGGSCIIAGSSPCTSVCPDLDPEVFYEGPCLTTTTTYFCDVFDFTAYFDCDIEPTPTPTPTPTPITTTTTTIPTTTTTTTIIPEEVCDVILSAITITPIPTPTPTPTPDPDQPVVNIDGNVTYFIGGNRFVGDLTNKLVNCLTLEEYYVSECILSGDTKLPTGTTMQAVVNGVEMCVTYSAGTAESSNAVLNSIVKIIDDCSECLLPTPTPTPTLTPTPTPTLTPTPTPTPTPNLDMTYVYEYCSNPNFTLATRYSGNNESLNDVTRYEFLNEVECWKLVEIQDTWIPNYPATFVIENYFNGGVVIGSFNNCNDCLDPQTNDVIKGFVTLTTPNEVIQISNVNYQLKINNNIVTTQTPIIVGTKPIIEIFGISNNQIINPRFTKIDIYDNPSNQLLLSIPINELNSYTLNSYTMPLADIRINVSIMADNYIQ